MSGDEIQNGKPAPDIFEAAARTLELAPTHCLAIEDTVPGVRAAVRRRHDRGGRGAGDRELTDFIEADVVVETLDGRELLALLDETVPA